MSDGVDSVAGARGRDAVGTPALEYALADDEPATRRGRIVRDVIDVLTETAPEIRAGLVGRRSAVDEENPSGERQFEADVWADRLLADRLSSVEGVGQYASEERSAVLACASGTDPTVSVAVDPLDGSSNLVSNNPMGTIFGIYDALLPARGRDLLAAGYVCYSPVTTMVVATDRVTEYELADGERRPVRTGVQIPEEPTVYGFGGRVPEWSDDVEAYVRELESELKLRYGGSMVADVNQVLTYGGVFGYPALRSRPDGKLRLQFEANPIGHVIETAGGRSSDGDRSVLEVEPEGLHDRTPVHVGTSELIDRLESRLS